MLLIKTSVRKSAINGMGLFSEELVPQGTIVARWLAGVDLEWPPDEFRLLPASAQETILHYGYKSKFNENFCLNFDDIRFINHSEDANLTADPAGHDERTIVAKRTIHPGEELTQNYEEIETGADNRIMYPIGKMQ